MNLDDAQLSRWVGNTDSRQERISAAPAAGLAATLDRTAVEFSDGDELPVPWHWLYFLPVARQSELGEDGHPALGGFLPPIPLPRRMWAAGQLQVARPLRIGDVVTRQSRVDSLQLKEGRSGALIFLRLVHELSTGEGLAIREIQDLVYRDHPDSDQPQPAGKAAPVDEEWRVELIPNPTLLFRFSALTFNGHRIHYDRDYATRVEHYPALVVQGPLMATLLLELVYRKLHGRAVSGFQFRAVYPTFDDAPFTLCGKRGSSEGELVLWGRNAQGVLTMEASATLS